MITYHWQRFKADGQTELPSLEAAARAAIFDMEEEMAWPIRITDGDGLTVWEQCGVLDTYTSLELFLEGLNGRSDELD